jgi:hypothetical protein
MPLRPGEDEREKRRRQLWTEAASKHAASLSDRLRAADERLGAVPPDIDKHGREVAGVSMTVGEPQILSRTPADEPEDEPEYQEAQFSRAELPDGAEQYSPDETLRMRAKYGDDFANWPSGTREWEDVDEMSPDELQEAVARRNAPKPGGTGSPLGALAAVAPGGAGVPQPRRPTPKPPVEDIEDSTIAGVVEGIGGAAERLTAKPERHWLSKAHPDTPPAPVDEPPGLAEKLPVEGMPPEQVDAVYKFATEQAKPQGPSEGDKVAAAMEAARKDAADQRFWADIREGGMKIASGISGHDYDRAPFERMRRGADDLEKEQRRQAESYAEAVAKGKEREWRQGMEEEKLRLATARQTPGMDPLKQEKLRAEIEKIRAETERLSRRPGGMDPHTKRKRELELALMEKKLNAEPSAGHGSVMADFRREKEFGDDVMALSKRIEGNPMLLNDLGTLQRFASEKSIPGVGLLAGSVPNALVGDDAIRARQAAMGVITTLLKEQSGLAVTENEVQRKLQELGMGPRATEKEFRNGVERLTRNVRDHLIGKESGFDDEIVETVRRRGMPLAENLSDYTVKGGQRRAQPRPSNMPPGPLGGREARRAAGHGGQDIPAPRRPPESSGLEVTEERRAPDGRVIQLMSDGTKRVKG